MGANLVLKDDQGRDLRVNPARDIAHFWGQLMAQAMARLDDEELWPAALKPHLKAAGITTELMVQGGLAFVEAMRMACRRGTEKPADALHKSGFLTFHPLIQVAICARIGQVGMGAWWEGIRDAAVEGTIPACHEDLVKTGLGLAATLNLPYTGELPE